MICVNKDTGFTSQDAVSVVKGILKVKKAGHTGTLDPMARGVLPVCIGAATRAASFISADRKSYETVMRLGIRSDTYDITGNVTKGEGPVPGEDKVREAVKFFEGGYMQKPPMYSAIHVNGKRAYELARRGEEADIPARRVEIYDIKLLSISGDRVSFSVTCSAGTYVRSLINDIGERLGCGAVMEGLLRTGCGEFTLKDSCTIRELEELRDLGRIGEKLISLPTLFKDLRRQVLHEEDMMTKATNGNPLPLPEGVDSGEKVYVCSDKGFFYGIYRADGGRNLLMPEKMFLINE